MTDTEHQPQSALIRDLLGSFVKGLKAFSLYLPNNPVYQQFEEEIRLAFAPVWQRLSSLSLAVREDGLEWEGEIVLQGADKTDSIAWTLFSDGVRTVTFTPGVEEDEIIRFLKVIHQAWSVGPDDEDDVLTLLWSQDFERIRYTVARVPWGDRVPVPIGDSEPKTSSALPEEVKAEIREEAKKADRTSGIIKTEEFDSTLYFLDQIEIDYLQGAIEREYTQDLSVNVLSLLLDTIELRQEPEVRAEVITVLGELLPYLLGTGNFSATAFLISQAKALTRDAPNLLPVHRKALGDLAGKLSSPEVLAQLFLSLEEADVEPSGEELAELITELRPEALETTLKWLKRLKNDEARAILSDAAERMARKHPAALVQALGASERLVVLETLRLVELLKPEGVARELGKLTTHPDAGVRTAVVETLTALESARTFELLTGMIDDPDYDVRMAALRALTTRRFQGALSKIQERIEGKPFQEADLDEQRLCFEVFGFIAGEEGVSYLEPLLLGKGRIWKRLAASDTRACAALALGTTGTHAARLVLQKARKDRDPVVRNAVAKALRGGE